MPINEYTVKTHGRKRKRMKDMLRDVLLKQDFSQEHTLYRLIVPSTVEMWTQPVHIVNEEKVVALPV